MAMAWSGNTLSDVVSRYARRRASCSLANSRRLSTDPSSFASRWRRWATASAPVSVSVVVIVVVGDEDDDEDDGEEHRDETGMALVVGPTSPKKCPRLVTLSSFPPLRAAKKNPSSTQPTLTQHPANNNNNNLRN